MSQGTLLRFSYFNRLDRRQKNIYMESDRIARVELTGTQRLTRGVETLEQALLTGERSSTQRAAQGLMDDLTESLSVSRLQVRVFERRPSWKTGELHGLYQADSSKGSPRHRVSVWMRTAQRSQVVKFRTFLRTLLHELCHHLDYEHFGLGDSFHTEGFFKRESSLLKQLLPSDERAPQRKMRPREKADLPKSPWGAYTV